MLSQATIQEHMPVLDATGEQFATVDHLQDAATTKLAKDKDGEHHYMSADIISFIDDAVHVDCTAVEAKAHWTTTPPVAEKNTRGLDERRVVFCLAAAVACYCVEDFARR